MLIDKELLDRLTGLAKASPRLRMNFDLRNSASDGSQRMLNAIEPGSVIPIHRHRNTSETVVVLRGSVTEEYYDDDGNLIALYEVSSCGTIAGGNAHPDLLNPQSILTVDSAASDNPGNPSVPENPEIKTTLSNPAVSENSNSPEEPSVSENIEKNLSVNQIFALNVPAGQWHTLRARVSGTVILEMKDGPYEPIQECDILK